MEQAWTVDKYDVPRGDLEFWATRRGILEESAKPERRVGGRELAARIR